MFTGGQAKSMRVLWPAQAMSVMFFFSLSVLISGCPDSGGELALTAPTSPLEAAVGKEVSATITLTNGSDSTVTVDQVIYEESPQLTAGPQFRLDGNVSNLSLEANQSRNLTVVFAPRQVGSASLTITIDSGSGEDLVHTLQGIGINNAPVVSGESWPSSLCIGATAEIVTTVSDVENEADLSVLAASLESSEEGPLAEGYFDVQGEFSASIALQVAGTHTLTLTAIDDEGTSGSYQAEILVDDTDENEDGLADCVDNDGDGYSADDGDCDDTSDGVNPDATDTCSGIDEDCDGTIDDPVECDDDGIGGSDYVDEDGDGYTEKEGDCDDSDSAIHPEAAEVCDGVDNNCDETTDEGFDADSDGFNSCSGDCDDGNAAINPSATESCDGVDEDCDEVVDNGFDTDSDGFTSCGGDCVDDDSSINPDSAELCDGVDQDCDEQIDEDYDQDDDGFTTCQNDCDDETSTVNPGATEVCNDIDDNCDGLTDEGFDEDGDGQTTCGGDCNDEDVSVYLGAEETCDGVDSNCDGTVDTGFDGDSDGWTECAGDCADDNAEVNPGADESCNGADDDCDDQVDEDFDIDRDGYFSCVDDCDDEDGSINPAAVEVCDGVDNDCDSNTDDTDADNDGYIAAACSPADSPDCNDHNPDVYPDNAEICNLLDDDCDGLADEDFDEDGDGYATCTGDCDDTDPSVHPLLDHSGWIEYPCNPVLRTSEAGGEGDLYADQASVIVDPDAPEDERYKAWFRYGSSDSEPRTIAYATSPDGIEWSTWGTVLDRGDEDQFDAKYMNYPSVLYLDGTYHMWYHGISYANELQIGYATSSDGLNWVKQNNGEPVLVPSTTEGDFDEKTVESPSVLWVENPTGGGEFYLYYAGSDYNKKFQIGLATSSDGIEWTKQGVVLPLGLAGEWDGTRLNFTRVLHNGDYFEMFYSAAGDTTLPTAFGYASSIDGYDWTHNSTPIMRNTDTAGGDTSWRSSLIYSPQTHISYDVADREVYTMWFGGCPYDSSTSSYGPFQTGMATNIKPELVVDTPQDGASYTVDDQVLFQIFVQDPWHGEYEDSGSGELLMDISVRIESDLDGVLATGNAQADGYFSIRRQLSYGTHTISITISDAGGLEVTEQITVYVQQ